MGERKFPHLPESPLRKAPEEGLRISHLEIVGMAIGLVGILPEKNRMGIVFMNKCEKLVQK